MYNLVTKLLFKMDHMFIFENFLGERKSRGSPLPTAFCAHFDFLMIEKGSIAFSQFVVKL